MRRAILVFLGILLAFLLFPGGAGAQNTVHVYVTSGDDGFAAPGAGDSTADIRASLAKKKGLIVVESADSADLILHVMSRHEEKQTTGLTTTTRTNDDHDRSVQTTTPNTMTNKIVEATIEAGSFKTNIHSTNQNMTWRGAADNIASQVDKFAQENFARIIEARAGRVSVFPQAERTQPTADTSRIKVGMTPPEVRDVLGEPAKKVDFGSKSQWSYDHFEVVFEDGRVTDVKF